MKSQPVHPGAAIGVLGGGQLGRMFALAAKRLGYRIHTYAEESDTPAGQVADKAWQSSFRDADALRSFAKEVSVVTYEFENIPAASIAVVERHVPVHPRRDVLHITQHRLREKTFLSNAGFPLAPFSLVRRKGDLQAAIAQVGLPCVLKTAGYGYDGKGQKKVHSQQEAEAVLEENHPHEMVCESFVRFDREISVIGVRGIHGSFVAYEPVENHHVNHILDLSLSPARVPKRVAQRAKTIAREIMEKLDVIGVMCVEMFLLSSGEILVNELAPRPHNSGHFTIDACLTSQFEQQVRAVCGLPLGSPQQILPAAMVNLLGDLWEARSPNFRNALSIGPARLHLYGKTRAAPGRKMGHITTLAGSLQQAKRHALLARKALISK